MVIITWDKVGTTYELFEIIYFMLIRDWKSQIKLKTLKYIIYNYMLLKF